MVTSATQSPAVAYAPDDIERPAGAGTEQPTVSADGKTITYKLRDDVKFSPPVNRTVTAADVKYAIERALLPGVANGYAQTYFNGVVGFDDAVKQAQSDPTGGAPDISGITAPGRHDPGDQARRHVRDRRPGRAVAADLGARCRRSTRSSSTRRTRRPTATTRSHRART